MAQEVITRVNCDWHLQGDPPEKHDGPHHIRFAIGGVHYEMDLCDAADSDWREAIEPYLAIAATFTPVASVPVTTSRRTTARSTDSDTKHIRAWAKQSSQFDVGDYGRIAPEVREAWVNAGSPRVG